MKYLGSIIFGLLFAFNSFSIDSLFNQGVESLYNEDFESAQAYFEVDVSQSPSFSSFYNLGVASGKLEQWDKAKWAFESALKYKPMNGDAQYNASFATTQINPGVEWTHPYPWIERIIFGFGFNLWIVMAVLSSIVIGVLLFLILARRKSINKTKKWCLRLLVPVSIVFLVSMYGIQKLNNHFNSERFAIVKSQEVVFYISPNGMEIDEKPVKAQRFYIENFFKDSTWVQVRSQKNNLMWIKHENLYIY
ncbi:hypothetical protein CW751_05090 [Brumimicrobium salinarum]|uniref:Uncharacterized protein n=1 Tax=Brumimicrobium salinarum TaxID=2058658 RepID=A0A2I0R4C3_9FLAO|nr:hypothetical protein [Brumimicrobium salinarum]PKR81432.1 hypothetical protein CW751_05090 [Brumimicrobium salinarum]